MGYQSGWPWSWLETKQHKKRFLSRHSVLNKNKSAVTADLFTFKKEAFNEKFYLLYSTFSVESFYHSAT